MQLRMKEDSVLTADCFDEVSRLVATHVVSTTVEDIFNELDKTQSLTGQDTSGDETPAHVDEEQESSDQRTELGPSASGGSGRPIEVLPEAPDTHDVLGTVAPDEENEQVMDHEVQWLDYEVY